ncbi:helix-turn-helix domain-containing protein [Streptomyces sp. NPDC055036]
MTLSQLLDGSMPCPLPAGALVLINGAMPFRIRGRTVTAMEVLLQQMAMNECAGLVVSGGPGAQQPFPQSIRDLSDDLAIPLLVTAAPHERWAGVHNSIQNGRVALAERRAAQLNMLVHQLPAQLADPKAMQRIADWLGEALDVQVLVSEPERVLATSPATAAEHLAQAIIRQSVGGAVPEGISGPHTQLISLAPASGAETVLAVARSTPFDEADMRLLRHAAKLLGLVDQARREYRAASDASDAARTAAVELLLDAEVDKARRVMANLAPGLLEAETARVFVIEAAQTRQDASVRRCETAMAGRALVVAAPREERQIIVIHPVRPGEEAHDSVAGDLTRLVAALGPDSSLGGSGVYSLSLLADALHEAVTAQRFARHQPDSIALSVQNTDLVSLLPQPESQLWARRFLRPLTQSGTHWEQFRETLPIALAYPYTVAARRLDLHRNTVTRRMARAAELLHVDFNAVTHRIAVGLAFELTTQREPSELPVATHSATPPSLHELFAGPQIHAWAEALLSTARGDRRDLLTTAASWLTCDAHIEPTARALGLSEVTVRSHLRALEGHISRDLASLTGLRDLHVSLHVARGMPRVADADQQLCANA